MPVVPDELIGDRAPPTSANGTPGAMREVPFPVVPGFDLQEVLAHGGTSTVYRAIETAVGRDAAVKVPDSSVRDGETLAACRDAYRIAARLQHPGIPTVFQVGTLADGVPFCAMRLVRGPSLADLLRDRTNPSIDRVRFVSLFEKVCEALAYVHARRIVHCDLKPQHVLVGEFGDVQVVGWGRVVDLAEGSRRPTEGTVAGTPAYLSPEQARGEWTLLAPVADVFALGGLLVEIMTGRPTYLGPAPDDLLRKAVAGDVSEALARLDYCGEDPSLVVLARRCLSPDPNQRPADAGELCRLLSGYRTVQEERLRKSEGERLAAAALAAEKEKRKQVQLGLVLVTGMFLICLGVFVWWQDRQNSLRKVVEGNQKAAERDRDAAMKERENQDLLRLKRQQLERDRLKLRPLVKAPKPLPPPEPATPVAPPPRDAGHLPPEPKPQKEDE